MKKIWIYTLFLLSFWTLSTVEAQAPKSILDERIFFLITSDELGMSHHPADEEIYYFRKDGTYRSYLNNQARDYGDYTYYVSDDENHARLLLTYSDSKSVNIYEIDLHFKTPRSGDWKWIQKEDPDLIRLQRGSFRFLTEDQAKELLKVQRDAKR